MWTVGSLRCLDCGEGEESWGLGWWVWWIGWVVGGGGGGQLGRCEEQGPLKRSSQTEPMTPPYWEKRGKKGKKKRKEGSHAPQVAILLSVLSFSLQKS